MQSRGVFPPYLLNIIHNYSKLYIFLLNRRRQVEKDATGID